MNRGWEGGCASQTNPKTGIRAVVTPAQSSYFAGEPFSTADFPAYPARAYTCICTITAITSTNPDIGPATYTGRCVLLTACVVKHFFTLSTNIAKVTEFGIAEENMFAFWDWVRKLEELLRGVNDMDKHSTTTPLEENLPVILVLLGIWYNDFYGSQSPLISGDVPRWVVGGGRAAEMAAAHAAAGAGGARGGRGQGRGRSVLSRWEGLRGKGEGRRGHRGELSRAREGMAVSRAGG
ncbi:hypothetical protein K523DRAFT_356166 [Schizophyllum commune Tattone D]|nr:hypothetical protein K523DRAFT_356166 [Schizophyllum commune Tattone D]